VGSKDHESKHRQCGMVLAERGGGGSGARQTH
jgi:hypothetical protein